MTTIPNRKRTVVLHKQKHAKFLFLPPENPPSRYPFLSSSRSHDEDEEDKENVASSSLKEY
jgi:hypothetical protein